MDTETVKEILKNVAEETAALNAEAEKYATTELQNAFFEGAVFARKIILKSLSKDYKFKKPTS
jgi:hypothetical protein